MLLIIANVFSFGGSAYAATFTFAQSSWTGDADTGLVAAHPGDASTWDKYYSVSGLTAGADVRLTSTSYGFTDDGATSTSPSANTKGGKFADGTSVATYSFTDDGATSTTASSVIVGGGFANGSNSSTALTVGSGTTTQSVSLLNAPVAHDATSTYPTAAAAAAPYNPAFDSSTNSVWVPNYNLGTVSKFNVSTGAITGTYTVGTNPTAAAFDPSTNSVWVANYTTSNVTKLSAADGSLIGTYDVGAGPNDITFDSSTNSIWTGNYAAKNVTKIRASDGQVLGTYGAGTFTTLNGILFESYTNSIWITQNAVLTKMSAADGTYANTSLGNITAQQAVYEPITNSIWVTSFQGNYVVKVNPSTGAVVASYTAGSAISQPIGIEFDAYTNSLWVANYGTNTVTRFSPSTPTTNIAVYNVGTSPYFSVYDSYTHSIWVSNNGSSNITKIGNIGSGVITSYTTGTGPQDVAFDPVNNAIWVGNESTNTVTKFNASTGATIGTYTSGGNNPWGIVYDSYTNSVWTANYGSGTVTKFNASNGDVVGTYGVGTAPIGVAFDSFTNSIWVANKTDSTLTKLSVINGGVIGTYTTGATTQPYAITYDSYTHSIWTANYNTGTVTKVNVSTGAITGTYTPSAGAGAFGIGFDSSTNSVWVGHYTSGNITKIDASTGSSVGYYYIGGRQYNIAFDSATNSMWAGNFAQGTVTKINASNGSVIGAYSVGGSSATGVAYDSSTQSIWVTTNSGTSVSKIADIATTVYATSGTFTSAAINLGSAGALTTLSYTKTTPTNTTLTVDVRAGDNGSTWGSWLTGVASGGDISSLGTHQYVQYRANLATTDTTVTPTLDSVAVNYSLSVSNGISGSGAGASVGIMTEGLLTALDPLSVATDSNGGYAVAISSDGASVYSGNNSSISMYSRDASTGTLTAISPANRSVTAGSAIKGIIVSPDGTSVYATDYAHTAIAQFSRSATSSYLTALSPATVTAGTNPYKIVISPDGTSVYTANYGSADISQYSRNTSTGALTALGTPTIAAGTNPFGIEISPDGTSVYATNYTSRTISMYSRNTSTGALTALSPATIATAVAPRNITISPDGTSVYVVVSSGVVSQYSRNTSTGALTALNPATIATDSEFGNSFGIDSSADGLSVYASHGGISTEPQFRRNASTGLLSDLSTIDTVSANCNDVVVSPDDRDVYYACGSVWAIYQYSRAKHVTSSAFTSAVIDLASPAAVTTFDYTKTTPANTTLTMDIRAGNTATPDGTWSSWTTGVASGGSISALASNRYFQYRANLTGTASTTPTLDSATINYSAYATSGNLVSSIYNSGSASNLIGNMTWAQSGTSDTETIKFQIRSADTSGGIDAAAWCGPDDVAAPCSGTSYFTVNTGTTIPAGNPLITGGDDQYFQYRVLFASSGAATPILTSATVSYVVNAAPEFDATYGTNGVVVSQNAGTDTNPGAVVISYKVRDTDTNSGSTNAGSISPTQQNGDPGFEYNFGGGWVTISADALGGTDTALKAVDTCSGGANCTTYTTHTATWFATSTLPSAYHGSVQIRVTVNDKEAANNTTTAESGTFALDTQVPVTYATLNASTGATTGTIILTTTDDSQTRYRLCNNSTFPTTDTEGNSCAWSSLAANLASSTVSSSWTPRQDAQDDEPVYLEVQDALGNTASRSFVAPATPPDFGFTDISDLAANPAFYGELLRWTTFQATTSSAFASYVLYTSTDGVTYSPLTTITNSATSNYLDTITSDTSSSHYYKMIVTTTQGNTSAYTSAVSDVPDGYGGQVAPPDSAPVISAISASALASSATITFTTDKLATSSIMYGTSVQDCSAYGSRDNTTAYVTSQSISLSGLLTDTSYYYCLQTTSVAGTTSTATSTTGTGVQLSFATSPGPNITNVHLGTIDDTTAAVLWDTATSSDSYVYYSTNADLSNPLNVGNATSTESNGVFNHQVVLTGLSVNTAYYYYVKSTDTDGNISTDNNSDDYYTIPAARNVTPPVISNISTPVQSATAVAVLWQTDKNASSQVYYGTSSGTYPNTTSLNSTLSIYHAMLLSSTTLNTIGGATDVSVSNNALTPETTYYFIAVSTDAAGNTATSSESSFSTATAPDSTAPGISSIAVPSLTLKSSSAVVSFTTDEVATSSVQYTVTGADSWTTVSDDTLGLTHSVSLSGLTANTSYTYQVRAGDPVGNTSEWINAGSPTFQTPTGPIISSVASSGVTATEAVITWNTANSADSYVYYATTTESGALVNPLTTGDASLVPVSDALFSHRISLSGLTSATTYYYYVKSTDADANSATNNNSGSFYTFGTTIDSTPPVISEVAAPITTTSAAVITWTTDKNATSQVEYGTAAGATPGAYTYMTVLNTTPVVLHVTTLSSDTLNTNGGANTLTANTTYYYRVRSVSETGVSAESDEETFSTSAPVTRGVTSTSSGTGSGSGTTAAATVLPSISSVTVDNIGAFNADVHIATNKNVVAFVHYGPTESYGSIEGEDVSSNAKTITLNKLQEGTKYHFRVVVYDNAGNTTASADLTFDTIFASEQLKNLTRLQNASDIQGKIEQLIQSALPSLAPPFITTPEVANITENAATITWKTNIRSYGALRYATDAEYLAKSNDYQTEVTSSQAQESIHNVELVNLNPNTLYHFQTRAYVFPQVVGTTTDMTFTTKAAPITANIVDIKNNGFSVVWQSDEPTTSIVEYTNLKTGDSNLITDSTPATYHNVPITNLPSGTSYSVRVSGINAVGNSVQAPSALSVTTSIDVTPPVISNFKVDNALVPGNTGFIQTVVGWQTDKPANSTVYYEQGAGAVASTTKELANKVQTLDVYSTAHIVILPHLTAGTVYRIKVVSTDLSGNTKVFGPTSIITPNQTQSVLDIIVKNFENTFKFLGAKQ